MSDSGDDAAGLLPLDGLPCSDCDRLLLFDEPNGWVVCGTPWCAAMGMEMPLWRAVPRRTIVGQDPNPAGLPRPTYHGLPVPWVTVVAAGRPWFRHLYGERMLTCQTGWICQICGQPLPQAAWLVVTADGRAVTPAGAHRPCLELAATACPYLRSNTTNRHVEITPAMISSDGRPLPEVRQPVVWQNWTLTPSPQQ